MIITLANTITLCTGLSISSVATNIRVWAGGAFSIISQSLGLEVGGSVTMPFYLAQAISVAFYIFAFSEGWQRIFPRHPAWLVVFVAFGLCFAIYLGLAYWVSRVATPEELVTTLTVMVDKSAWGPAVLAGILAATFSAALNSLVGAPRMLQAIAEHGILPGGEILARETPNGEPRPAMIATGLIGLATIFFGLGGGGLNAIAPLMTMFFLITYAVLNGVVLIDWWTLLAATVSLRVRLC